MDILELINNKDLKSKEKTERICSLLLNNEIIPEHLIAITENLKDPAKAICIEALEFSSKLKPEIINKKCFQFVTQSLTSKAPRVKWESAKVIGNSAHLFVNNLDDAIKNLLDNSKHEGIVVRWSAAYALGEIIKLKTKHNKYLVPAIEGTCRIEEKNSIKNIFFNALKIISK